MRFFSGILFGSSRVQCHDSYWIMSHKLQSYYYEREKVNINASRVSLFGAAFFALLCLQYNHS